MLPETVDEPGRYQIKISDRDGLFVVVLVDEDEMQGRSHVSPLWRLACGDEESRNAVTLWLSVRRHHWQDWGRLATAVGNDAFASYIAGLMERQPPGHFQGMGVNRLADGQQVEFGILLATSDMHRVEPLYIHTFEAPALREGFFAWLDDGEKDLKAKELVRLAIDEGTLALARTLDEIASKEAGIRPKRNGA